jgi:hypothetical protein
MDDIREDFHIPPTDAGTSTVRGWIRQKQKLKKWVCTTRNRPGTKTENNNRHFFFLYLVL